MLLVIGNFAWPNIFSASHILTPSLGAQLQVGCNVTKKLVLQMCLNNVGITINEYHGNKAIVSDLMETINSDVFDRRYLFKSAAQVLWLCLGSIR